MGLLKDIETFLLPPDQLHDLGIPSISIAYRQDPWSEIQPHVFTHNDENPNTLYQAASISKALTSLAVAKLIDLAQLTYDTRVVDHVPEVVWRDIVDARTEHLMQYVTVGLLLSHRAGLSQGGFPGYVGEPPSDGQVVAGLSPANTPRIRFDSFPGSQFKYSGGGFVVLQILLEHITHTPFAQLMQETVLTPLGMHRSRFGDLPEEEENYARAHVTASTPGTTDSKGYHRFRELAAAGLWTTPTDLIKATSAIQQSLHAPDGFLTPATAKAMLQPVSPGDAASSLAMGWAADGTFFAHAGDNDPGYQCYVLSAHTIHPASHSTTTTTSWKVQEQGLMSVAVMANSATAWTTLRRLVAAVLTLKSWPLYDSLPGGFGSLITLVPFMSPEGIYLTQEWKGWIGHWTVVEEEKEKKKTKKRPNEAANFETRGEGGGIVTPSSHDPSSNPISTVGTPIGHPELDARLEPLSLGGGGGGGGEYEIYEDEGTPMAAFDGIREGMRMRPGTVPWVTAEGRLRMVFVVDGLEVGLRLGFDDEEEEGEGEGERVVELVMGRVRRLRRRRRGV